MNYYNNDTSDVTFSTTVKILGIKKKTTVEIFKDLKVGDKIIIYTSLLNMNMMHGAPVCKVFSNQNSSMVEKSAKQIYNILQNFEYSTIL